MTQLYKIKITLSIIASSLFVILGFEIKKLRDLELNNLIFILLLISVSYLLSRLIVPFLSLIIFRIKWFRKLILGDKWIEGIWLLKGVDKDKTGIYSGVALGEIKIIPSSLKYKVTTYGINTKSGDMERFTSSITTALDDDLNYINFFQYCGLNMHHKGLGFGQFIVKPSDKYPQDYEGYAMDLEEKIIVKQRGLKLDRKKIAKLKKKYKDVWINEYLKEETTLPNNV